LILLDENTLRSQRESLEARRLPVRKVGLSWGREGMSDEEILARLKQERNLTFFTRDAGLYRPLHCHTSYCLAVVHAPAESLAAFALKLLRHPRFKTHALRMGKVLRLQHSGIVYWEPKAPREIHIEWT